MRDDDDLDELRAHLVDDGTIRPISGACQARTHVYCTGAVRVGSPEEWELMMPCACACHGGAWRRVERSGGDGG